jgi:hypothetical protein
LKSYDIGIIQFEAYIYAVGRSINIPVMKILICLICILISACHAARSSRTDSVQKQNTQAAVCDQAIKYTGTPSEQEKEEDEAGIDRVTLIVNPAKALISVIVQDSVKIFDMEIVTVKCNLNKNLTEGEAIYQGFIIQRDGKRTPSTFKLKSENGAFIMTTPESEAAGKYAFQMQKWEILK